MSSGPTLPEDEAHRLHFDPMDLRVLLVKMDAEVADILNYLKMLYGEALVEKLTGSESLVVGRQNN